MQMEQKKQLSVTAGVGALAVLVGIWLVQCYNGQAVTSKLSTAPLVSDSGLRILDDGWQDCEGSDYKKAFPDLDYALYGYDILNGYPMTTGRDPGFTHPIFKADYTSSKQTADCRYSIPKGVNAMPSEACVVSFESHLLRNKEEMDTSLGAQAQVSGGGWGFEFSASASYKSNTAKMSAGENFFIISQAKCDHYFTTIDFSNPPPFDPGFLAWADNLTHSPQAMGDFIQYYGTHFLADVTFGAKFIQQHKMSQATYANNKDSAISLEAQASYAGLVSVGAGFSLTEEQRNAASNFSQNVETSTITVGSAPPSNGDAMTWAASAQNNPLPTRYKLMGIDVLFSEQFKNVLTPNVDYRYLREHLSRAVMMHCELMKQDKKIPTCEGATQIEGSGIIFDKGLKAGYKWLRDVDEATCKAICLEDEKCFAVQYTRACPNPQVNCSADRWVCRLVGAGQLWEMQEAKYTSKIIIFLSKLQWADNPSLFIERATLNGSDPVAEYGTSQCESNCKQIAHCDIITYGIDDKCFMYSVSQKPILVAGEEYDTVQVLWKNMTTEIIH